MAKFTEEVIVSLKDEFSATAKKFEASIGGMKSAATGLAGALGIAGLGAIIKKSIDEYAESEKAVTQLSFALKNVGITSQSVLRDYKEFAEAQERNTTFDKEQILGIERLFTQYGLYGEQLKRATKATLDFAAAKGLDADTAANLFSKAAAGNVEVLKRYGLQVDIAQVSTKGLNAVLEASEKKFKDFSSAAADTTYGRLDQFSKSLKNLGESLGSVFAGLDRKYGAVKGVTSYINEFTDALERNEDPLQKMGIQMAELNHRRQELEAQLQDKGGFFGFLNNLRPDGREAATTELQRVTNQIKDLDVAIGKLQKTSDGSTKPTSAIGFKIDPAIQQKIDDAKHAYQDFYDGLVIKTEGSYTKIAAQRNKDINDERFKWEQLSKFLVKGSKDYDFYYQEHEDAITRIDRQAQNDRLNLINTEVQTQFTALSNFANDIKTNVSKAFTEMSANVLQTLGKYTGGGVNASSFGLVGTVFSVLTGAAFGIQSFIAGFDSELKTAFKATTDFLNELDQAISDVENRLQDLRNHENKQKAGLEGTVGSADVEGYNNYDLLEGVFASGRSIGVASAPAAGQRHGGTFEDWFSRRYHNNEFHWNISDQGDFEVYWNDYALAILRGDTGQWLAVNVLFDLDTPLMIGKFVYDQALKSGAFDPSNIGVAASDRKSTTNPKGAQTSGARSFNSSTALSRASSATAAASGSSLAYSQMASSSSADAQTVINITVNAIDQQGVQDFVVNQLAPIMRDASGRAGIVFLNGKGVSDNA